MTGDAGRWVRRVRRQLALASFLRGLLEAALPLACILLAEGFAALAGVATPRGALLGAAGTASVIWALHRAWVPRRRAEIEAGRLAGSDALYVEPGSHAGRSLLALREVHGGLRAEEALARRRRAPASELRRPAPLLLLFVAILVQLLPGRGRPGEGASAVGRSTNSPSGAEASTSLPAQPRGSAAEAAGVELPGRSESVLAVRQLAWALGRVPGAEDLAQGLSATDPGLQVAALEELARRLSEAPGAPGPGPALLQALRRLQEPASPALRGLEAALGTGLGASAAGLLRELALARQPGRAQPPPDRIAVRVQDRAPGAADAAPGPGGAPIGGATGPPSGPGRLELDPAGSGEAWRQGILARYFGAAGAGPP